MTRWFCRVEYRGTDFAGWQMQTKGEASVQSTIEAAISTVCRVDARITGAGRTDAGVHGSGQGMHVDLPDECDFARKLHSINSIMPHGVALYSPLVVSSDFHARYSAVERRYRYTIVKRKSPLWHGRAWQVTLPLDWERMQFEAQSLLGAHDFTAFCASRSSTKNMVCDVRRASFDITPETAVFTIAANRFIYKMVRSVVGTLVDMGRGTITDSMADIIAGRARAAVGETAPPWGLVLEHVAYHEID